jgi:ketose-bisphosphate aldolase
MSKRIREYMVKASRMGVLIPAFNVAHLEMVKPICETLKRLGTFGIAETSRIDIEKFTARGFDAVFEEYKNYADPTFVALHQDHVPVIDEDGFRVDYLPLLKQAIELGYDSVMIDGSRVSLEENIQISRSVVEMAHGKDVPVEAELGAVLGHESGPLPPYDELFKSGKGFTSPEDAKRFVEETGVDWLSVAVGNIHGPITGAAKDAKKVQAKLSIPQLKKIREATGIPLVLHGGSGVQREYVLEAIKNGLTKINIGTDIRQAYEKTFKETEDVKKAQDAVSELMEYLIVEYYGIQGSKLLLDSD